MPSADQRSATQETTVGEAAEGSVSYALADGESYLESLRDGREVWYRGERLADVTTHPSFAGTAGVIASIYDAVERDDELSFRSECGARALATYRPTASVDDLAAVAHAMERVHRIHLGFLSQGPEYKGPVISGLRAAAEYFEPYSDNVRSLTARVRDLRLYPANAFTDPQVDRSKRPSELANPDLILRAVRERDDGIVVRGAKMVSTAAVYTHEALILRYGGANRLTDEDSDYALIFMVPVNAPGLKLVARESFQRPTANPLDAPLSSLFDENDSILVFDDVFVPWERVIVYRDPERADSWLAQTNLALNLVWGDMVRWGTKFEFLAALAVKIAKGNGTIAFRGIQQQLGEMLAWTALVRNLATAAWQNAEPYYDGVAVNHVTVLAFRALRPLIYKRVIDLAREIAGSGVVPIPASLADLQANPELQTLLQSATGDGEERVRLYRLAWDALHSDMAARHELFERLHTGNTGDVAVQLFFGAGGMGMDQLLDAKLEQLSAMLGAAR